MDMQIHLVVQSVLLKVVVFLLIVISQVILQIHLVVQSILRMILEFSTTPNLQET